MENDKVSLLVNVARMYYENNYNQAAIANRLNISRPYVSKLLQEAYTAGIVDIQIKDPMTHETSMEKKIRSVYSLERVFIIPCNPGESHITQVSLTAAKYLNYILRSDDIIGISNGSTMAHLASHIIQRDDLENIKVVQLTGSYTNLSHYISTSENARLVANALGGTPYALPLPMFLQSAYIREQVFQDQNIHRIAKLQEQCNIALFSVGTVGTIGTNSLINSGFLSQEQLDELYQKGSVGDIFSHFIDKNGSVCDKEIDARNTSLSLSSLKQKKHRICLASGRSKLNVLKAALNGGYITTLIIDEELGKGLLN